MLIVCPGVASSGTRNVVLSAVGAEKVMLPGYVPASLCCHHFTATAFRSGSEASPSRLTVLPGRAEISSAPLILIFGGCFASLNFGVTAHFSRDEKSFCAAAKKAAEMALVCGVTFGIMLAKSM